MTKYSIIFLLLFLNTGYQNDELNKEFSNYEKERVQLNIPGYGKSYQENFASIESVDNLLLFKKFYEKYDSVFRRFDRDKLLLNDKINLDRLQYIILLQLKRFSLELNFKQQNDTIPKLGLYTLKDHKEWYQYYAKYYTSLETDPDEIFRYGEAQVKKVNAEINEIQKQLGYENRDKDFYTYLKDEKFYLTNTNKIEKKYKQKEAVIRKNLHKLFENTAVSEFDIVAADHGPQTMSPGVYSSGHFVYDFSDGKQNTRLMDFLILHEGIPGHHYQFSLQSNKINRPTFAENVSFPGNFEGWACYAESLGKELGLYQSLEEELSKCEWDLVRSLRLMLDVGIHYYGWSIDKAFALWNENIKGQDDIAYREITRVIYWPGQSLSYKIGARKIEELKTMLHVTDSTIKNFHSAFLSFSIAPLDVIEKNIGEVYNVSSIKSIHSSPPVAQ